MRSNVRYLLYRQLVNDDLLSGVKIGILCKKMLNLLEIMIIVKITFGCARLGGSFLGKNFMIFEESFIDERRSGGILLLYFLIRGMVKRLSRVTLTHLFGVRIPVPLLEDRMMSSILFCFLF